MYTRTKVKLSHRSPWRDDHVGDDYVLEQHDATAHHNDGLVDDAMVQPSTRIISPRTHSFSAIWISHPAHHNDGLVDDGLAVH